MPTRRSLAAIAVALATISLGACSSDDGGSTEGQASGASAEAEHNDADVTFVQGMIPHHEQAIEMAQLAARNAEDERVIELAEGIEAAQAPEIEQMRGWLEAWGESEDGGMDDMGHGGDSDSAMGQMSGEDMAALESASGAVFDQMFLEMMIEHHEGAIEMAETESADGQDTEAVELAETIIAAQQAEIDEMQGLLEQL